MDATSSRSLDQRQGADVETAEIDAVSTDNISTTAIFYANQMLRTTAVCYQDFESWPPTGTNFEPEEEVSDSV